MRWYRHLIALAATLGATYYLAAFIGEVSEYILAPVEVLALWVALYVVSALTWRAMLLRRAKVQETEEANPTH